MFITHQKHTTVPAYSQWLDVSSPSWQPRASGIVALKIIMDFLGAHTPPIDDLIKIGIGMGAYNPAHGWKNAGLAAVARKYGLRAERYDLSQMDPITALRKLKVIVRSVPCMVSVHKDFDPTNGSHLIVVKRITGSHVSYNDPAATERTNVRRTIKIDPFLEGWRQRGVLVKR